MCSFAVAGALLCACTIGSAETVTIGGEAEIVTPEPVWRRVSQSHAMPVATLAADAGLTDRRRVDAPAR